MVVKSFIPKKKVNDHHRILLEKHLLEKHFAFLKCLVTGRTLICRGFCQPTEYSQVYEYRIKFTPGIYPKVFVVEPEIEYDDDIHMYASDNSLCLFYPRDFSWTSESHLYNTILPWTHEWFLYYEKYKISGKWEHPFVSHRKI
jgi:hypothetical protein